MKTLFNLQPQQPQGPTPSPAPHAEVSKNADGAPLPIFIGFI
ncbi:hypothetical protein V6Z12_D08G031200 [Gossypium hirsutum]